MQGSYDRNGQMDIDMNIHQDSDIEDMAEAAQRQLYARPADDFDNIDVNLDTDINNLDKNNQ